MPSSRTTNPAATTPATITPCTTNALSAANTDLVFCAATDGDNNIVPVIAAKATLLNIFIWRPL